MKEAIGEALKAEAIREVPIGAVVVHQGQIIGRGYNLRETTLDPLAHAEMIAIKQASEHLQAWRLFDCQLYVTLEPCPMCAGAIVQARSSASDLRNGGSEGWLCGDVDELAAGGPVQSPGRCISGVLQEECSTMLTQFFRKLRGKVQLVEGMYRPFHATCHEHSLHRNVHRK